MGMAIGNPTGKIQKAILDVHWAVWCILIAAALNLILAFTTVSIIGGLLNILACLASLIALVGIAPKID